MFTDVDNTDVETKKANEGIGSINWEMPQI